ncbi:MAG: DUF2059 domain-containing protein [Saprospiraceae bacterium]|nr:DUF2059 domain-containing protein [Saprospiraceae bacterium]
MKTLLTTFSLVMLFTVSSFSQTDADAEYKEVLNTLLEVSGTEANYKVAIDQMLPMFKQQYSSVPEETWMELDKEFKSISIASLVDLLVPVYQKHLTIDDLKEVIAFYNTPIGKKFAEKSPFITQESMQVGQEWGMKIGQKVANKMSELGY